MSFEPSTHVLKARWYTVIGAILLPLAAVAGIVALAIGRRGREDTVSWLTGRQPLESGRYCNNDGDCWDLERGDPVMVWIVTPGGARFGDGIRARMSEVRDWDFEIDHGRGRVQFLVLSPSSIYVRTRANGKTGEFDTYGRR